MGSFCTSLKMINSALTLWCYEINMALINYPQWTVMMIGHYLSFTIARSMVSWHRIPGVIIVCIHCSAWAGVLILKGEMCCVYCRYGVYYSAASNINSWNIFRIGTDFLPGNHKIWFPISTFSLPPWSLQNMIEYLRSLGINNRLHKDISNMHCCRVIGCTRGWFVVDPKISVPEQISLSYPLVDCKCKNAVKKFAAYFNSLHSYLLIFGSLKANTRPPSDPAKNVKLLILR